MHYLLLPAFEDGCKWQNRIGLPFGSSTKNILLFLLTYKIPRSNSLLHTHSRASGLTQSHTLGCGSYAPDSIPVFTNRQNNEVPASDFIPPTVLWLLHQSNPCWQCCVSLHPFQEKACSMVDCRSWKRESWQSRVIKTNYTIQFFTDPALDTEIVTSFILPHSLSLLLCFSEARMHTASLY